jgi:uncharacterized membrane protein YhhN
LDVNPVSPSQKGRIDMAIVPVVAFAIVGAYAGQPNVIDGWHWLHWLSKPLATVLMLCMARRAAPPISARYRRWIAIGMLFSLAGDVFLMLPIDAFVPGLVAFLIAHLCFVRALTGDTRFAARPLGLLACLAYGGINLWLLWSSLPDALHVPVVVYVVVLSCMAGQAIARASLHARDALSEPARWAAIGALSFLVSDTLLAWDRFRLPLSWSALGVLGTYYAALWCLARSVQQAQALRRSLP